MPRHATESSVDALSITHLARYRDFRAAATTDGKHSSNAPAVVVKH